MEREPEKCEDEMGKQWMPRQEKGDDGGNELQKIEPRGMGRRMWNNESKYTVRGTGNKKESVRKENELQL